MLTVSVKPSGAGQRLVEGFGKIRRGDDDDALGLLEPVELDKELVEGLFHVVLRRQRDTALDPLGPLRFACCRSRPARR